MKLTVNTRDAFKIQYIHHFKYYHGDQCLIYEFSAK